MGRKMKIWKKGAQKCGCVELEKPVPGPGEALNPYCYSAVLFAWK